MYSALKEQLLSAQIGLGERLYESAVAEQFDASRTPVREALMQLEKERLITRDGRAYMVLKMTRDDLAELWEARLCIECQTVKSAISFITADDVETLRRLVDLMWKAIAEGNIETFHRVDSQFHLRIAELSRNRVLHEILIGVHERVMMVRNFAVREMGNLASANEEHVRIIEAIARRNDEAAIAELKAHLVLTNVAAMFEEND